jgi:F0F1-type ATP synthase alpha subunit
MLSDGIARVYGLNNVQAEELVEYVQLQFLSF